MVKLAKDSERQQLFAALMQKVEDALNEVSDTLAGEGEQKAQYEKLKDADEQVLRAWNNKKAVESKLDLTDTSPEGLKKALSVMTQGIEECASKLLPVVLFKARLIQAAAELGASKGEEADVEAFKKAFRIHVNEFSTAFRAQGKSEIADYVTAAGLALLGALVAIITSPLFLVSPGHGHWLKIKFFSGPETDKSKEFQKKLDDEVFTSCLPAAGA